MVPTATYYAEHSGPALDWLKEQGVEFKDELNPGIYDPMSVLRVAWAGHMGTSLISGMQACLDAFEKEGQVKILMHTNASELLTEEGAVVGVLARKNTGGLVRVAAKSTILAAGGYEANEEVLSGMFDQVARSFMTASKGDTLRLAMQAGAGTHHMEANTLTGGVLPNDGFYSNIYLDTAYEGLKFVNQEGRVITLEGARTLAKSLAWAEAPGNVLYAILPRNAIKEDAPLLSAGNAWMPTADKEGELYQELASEGSLIVEADSLEELGEKFSISLDALEGKEGFEEGPFVGIKTMAYCSWATGGPLANEKMEVLTEDGFVIPGLYVCGEGAGHGLVAGRTPISGMYLGMCATFGLDAAEGAASYALE